MRKSVFLVVVLLVLMLAACNRSSVAGLQVTKTNTDSTVVLERLRVDTFTIPADTVQIVVQVNCDSAGKVAPLELKQKSTRAGANIKLDANGVLNMVFDCRALEQEVRHHDSVIKYYKQKWETSNKTVVETKTVIPDWCWWCAIYTACSVAYFIGKLVIKYGKYLAI